MVEKIILDKIRERYRACSNDVTKLEHELSDAYKKLEMLDPEHASIAEERMLRTKIGRLKPAIHDLNVALEIWDQARDICLDAYTESEEIFL